MRAPLTVIVAMLLVACTASEPTQQEQVDDAREGIVGGTTTNGYPAVGALTRFGSTHCTGTLISARRVVTAAHCVVGVSAGSLRFVLGATVSQPEHTLRVASLRQHPSYNGGSLNNDIGYVDLVQDAPVAAMPILESMDSSWRGRDLAFVGFGANNGFSQTGFGRKRVVTMPIAVGATQFSYNTQGKNTCNGDSGGPAFANVGGTHHIAGVTSYGDANCVDFGVDTRVDVYTDFLGVDAGVPPADPCRGETFEGRCDDNTVVWCENNQVQTSNCSSQNKSCGFSEANNYFACVDAAPIDPCNGETFAGRCDGSTVVWCEAEQVKTLNCIQCGFDSANGYYNCI